MIEFMPDTIFILPLSVVFIKSHNVEDRLWVLLLFLLCDATLLDHSLPFLGEALLKLSNGKSNQRNAVKHVFFHRETAKIMNVHLVSG